MCNQKLTISKLARLCDIGIETVRYYQRIGLISKPDKPLTGYRIYPDETVHRLKFIQRAKELGFSLAEIHELLLLDSASCQETQQIASQKLQLILEKISSLQAMADMLDNLLQSCKSNPDSASCPIIDSLSRD